MSETDKSISYQNVLLTEEARISITADLSTINPHAITGETELTIREVAELELLSPDFEMVACNVQMTIGNKILDLAGYITRKDLPESDQPEVVPD